MAEYWIVELLNVLGNVQGSGFSVGGYALLEALLPQVAEKGFSDRIVLAVCPSTHAGF